MANPRFIDKQGNPSEELLGKLAKAKAVYFGNLDSFCAKQGIDRREFTRIEKIYLIGSHAKETGWHNETSDVDFKLVLPESVPMDLHHYKREVLDKILCPGDKEKHRWIDLFFVHSDYQVLPPRFDLTRYWPEL